MSLERITPYDISSLVNPSEVYESKTGLVDFCLAQHHRFDGKRNRPCVFLGLKKPIGKEFALVYGVFGELNASFLRNMDSEKFIEGFVNTFDETKQTYVSNFETMPPESYQLPRPVIAKGRIFFGRD